MACVVSAVESSGVASAGLSTAPDGEVSLSGCERKLKTSQKTLSTHVDCLTSESFEVVASNIAIGAFKAGRS